MGSNEIKDKRTHKAPKSKKSISLMKLIATSKYLFKNLKPCTMIYYPKAFSSYRGYKENIALVSLINT